MPADEPAHEAIPDLTRWVGRSGRIVTSPARRCHQPGATVEPALAPWDLGWWTGQEFAQLDLVAWRTDATFDGHGGESLVALHARAAGLLARWHGGRGRLAAVTHAAVIKSMVVHALRAPLEAVWDVDVRPASVTELHATPSGWRLTRLACPEP